MLSNDLLKPDIIESAMARISRQRNPRATHLKKTAITERPPGALAEDVSSPPHARPKRSVRGKGAFEGKPERFVPLRSIGTHFLSALLGAAAMWFALSVSNRWTEPPASKTTIPPPAALPEAARIVPAKQLEAAAERSQVLNMLELWRQSWSNRAVDSYFGFYSAHFVPADGTSRSAWAEGRRKNLLGKAKIDVQIDQVRIEAAGDRQVKVQLLQSYASGAYKEIRQPKTLLLIHEDNTWRIAGEWQGLR